jgi:hypothetical protein
MHNNNKTAFNESYITLDDLYAQLGLPLYLKWLWLYVHTPLNGLGVLLNSLTFIILQHREFKGWPLYDYMRVYSVNSAVLSLFQALLFMAGAQRTITWPDPCTAYLFTVYTIVPITTTSNFYATVIDVLISLDRIGILKPDVAKFMQQCSAYKTSLAVLIGCLLFNFPFFFVFTPVSVTANVNATWTETVWTVGLSSYGSSLFGFILTMIIFVVRDVLLTVLEIILNIASVYFFKQYLNKKAFILNKKVRPPAASDVVAEAGVRLEEIIPLATTDETVVCKETQMSTADQRLCVMVVIMCGLSIFEHMCLVIAPVYLFFGNNALIFQQLSYIGFLSLSFKHTVNFFLLFAFNKKFRVISLRIFRLYGS